MLVDNVPLRVKLDGYALEFKNLEKLKQEVSAAQLHLMNARNALDKAKNATAPTNSDPNHCCEIQALRYATKRRKELEVFYLGEDVFHEYQRIFIAIMESERDARQRIEVLHADIRGRAERVRKEEYFMSTKCVFERFAMQERAHEEKMRMIQEHADFLFSLRIVEEEERMASIYRARVRRQGALHQQTAPDSLNTLSSNYRASLPRPSAPLTSQQLQLPLQMQHPTGDGFPPHVGANPYGSPPVFHHQQPQYPQLQNAWGYAAVPPMGPHLTYGQPPPPQHPPQHVNMHWNPPPGRSGYPSSGFDGGNQR